MTPTLRIIFAGSGEFGLPTLRALLSAGHQLVQLFSQPDRPAGRGRKLAPTPISPSTRNRAPMVGHRTRRLRRRNLFWQLETAVPD